MIALARPLAKSDPSRLLIEQTRAVVELFRAVERHFQDPRGPFAAQAQGQAESAMAAATKLEAALEEAGAPAGFRKRVFLISRALGRFAASGRSLALEAERYGVSDDPRLEELAHETRRSAEELAESVERLAAPRAFAALRAAGRAEHLRRGATRELGEEPRVVVAIKLRGLQRRFSEAALHAGEAAELLGEALSK